MGLVYLSPLPWNSFAQRPHKFVQWFHDRIGEPVQWVEPYPTRFPRLGDLRRLVDQPVQQNSPRPTEMPPWLTVLRPGALPVEPLPGSAMLNRPLWQDVFKSVDDFLARSGGYIVVGKPSVLALELLKRHPESPSLYDAMDDFPAFYEGLSRAAFARRELQIVRDVDAVWASSTELKRSWSRYHENVHLVLNGLDQAMVLEKLEQPLPPRLPTPGRKIFGYVGTIASWFDWDWVRTLAEARPEDEIRLIGPVFDAPAGTLPGNVEMLPACDHATALKAMAEFDVGLIPFKKNKLTSSVDPIKYYEYRALALPVLSADFGEMRCRSNASGVFINETYSDIASLAEQALNTRHVPQEAHVFARENTWEQRFDSANLATYKLKSDRPNSSAADEFPYLEAKRARA